MTEEICRLLIHIQHPQLLKKSANTTGVRIKLGGVAEVPGPKVQRKARPKGPYAQDHPI